MKSRETLQIGTLKKDVADKIQNCKVTKMQNNASFSQIGRIHRIGESKLYRDKL